MALHFLRMDTCFRPLLDCSLRVRLVPKDILILLFPITNQETIALYRQCTDLQITFSAQKLDVGFLLCVSFHLFLILSGYL